MKIKFKNLKVLLIIFLTSFFSLTACSKDTSNIVQGYVEADFIYVASPVSGRLEQLSVKQGDTISKDQLLFELEKDPENFQVSNAQNQFTKAQKQLADLKKGLRPTEINSLKESLRENRANLQLAQIELNRRKKLLKSGTISKSEYDLASNEYDRRLHQAKKIEADLKTAQMGSRDDLISAAISDVKSAQALFEQTRWQLNQKNQSANCDAIVFETLYQEGEWVPAGKPVVSLLPPKNKKIRFYVSQEIAGRLVVGEKVKVSWDGCGEATEAVINFISPQVEYTPPIIYSSQSREKLVIMIETFPQSLNNADLHPGQPVDVVLAAGEKNE